MTILNDPVAMERRVRNLEMAVKRAKGLRGQLKNLINQAENVLTNHAGRISTNEDNILTGRDKLIDHEARITALEGGGE